MNQKSIPPVFRWAKRARDTVADRPAHGPLIDLAAATIFSRRLARYRVRSDGRGRVEGRDTAIRSALWPRGPA